MRRRLSIDLGEQYFVCMAKRVRVGIIGAGGNTRIKHIPGFRRIDGVEILSVCNRSMQSSNSVAEEFDIPETAAVWTEIVEDDRIDAVLIGTWPYLHHTAAVAALNAGKHVLCEARMAMDSAEARDMLAVSRANPHLIAQVVPSPMTLHVDETVKRLISQGYLGEVRFVEVRDLAQEYPDPDAPLAWRQDRWLSGNNVMTLGIWYEALLRWVGETSSVSALGSTFISMRNDLADGGKRAITIPDHLSVIGNMACGAQLEMTIGRATGHGGAASATLYGSNGTLQYAGGRLSGGTKGDQELGEITIAPGSTNGWRVEEEFIGAIRGEEPVRLTTFEAGVSYMEFTDAVTISAAQGVRVPLPLS